VDEQNRDRILRGGITAVAFRSGDGQLVTGDIRGTILKWLLPASTEADAREPELAASWKRGMRPRDIGRVSFPFPKPPTTG